MPDRMRHVPHGRDEVVTWLIGRGMMPAIHTPEAPIRRPDDWTNHEVRALRSEVAFWKNQANQWRDLYADLLNATDTTEGMDK